VRDDGANYLGSPKQFIDPPGKAKPYLGVHLGAWDIGNLLDLNLRDLLDSRYGCD
jgi:hypothetical protein